MSISAIIDCDPGHDDVMAILLGARTLDLRGHHHGPWQRVAGEHHAQRAPDGRVRRADPHPDRGRACRARWSARPATRPRSTASPGSTARRCPRPPSRSSTSTRVDFILDRSHDVPDLHLMPVGPLTNIASALIKDPTLPSRIKQISLMGGSLTFGNVTPAAEFNIWCRPGGRARRLHQRHPDQDDRPERDEAGARDPRSARADPRDGQRRRPPTSPTCSTSTPTAKASTPGWTAARCTTRWRWPRWSRRTS